MKKILSIFIAMLVLASALLAGCAAKETTEATEAAPTTQAAKTWLIVTDTVFKPFEYTNEKNEFVGIDVDLLAAIAKDQGFNYKLEKPGLGVLPLQPFRQARRMV